MVRLHHQCCFSFFCSESPYCELEGCDEGSLRVTLFAFPILAVGGLGTRGAAALAPWLTALTALRKLHLWGKARCLCGVGLCMLQHMTAFFFCLVLHGLFLFALGFE
jgi:hypothetical protein